VVVEVVEHLLEVVVEMESLEDLVVEEPLKQNQTEGEQVIHLLQIHLKVILVVMDSLVLTLQTMRQVEVVEQQPVDLMLAQELVEMEVQEHQIQF
tara:strand:+ start:191 stop:475 length:285 start_codon:yes stop_codon:yes gene_type:complete